MGESDDGGFDEFDELRPRSFSNSATFATSTATCSVNVTTWARNAAFSASNSTIRASASTPAVYTPTRGQWRTNRALRAIGT